VSEIKQLVILDIVTLVIYIIGLDLVTVIPPLFESNLEVNSYDAVLFENGNTAC